jgi:neurotransmitter:Na+ symporter, NSS family
MSSERWSSKLSFYLAAVGASVGLGSVWRFPYLTGANGGSAFIFVFVLAILGIATPLLVAEFVLGRRSRRNPAAAAGEVAASVGGSRRWNLIGLLGTWTAVIIMSYYTIIAGWVMAYVWKCASGELTALARADVPGYFHEFLSRSLEIGGWHLAFIVLAGAISAGGVTRGIEVATRIRAPGLLILMLILDAYALIKGNVHLGLRFALTPDFGRLSGGVVLAAVGQAFFATGVGMGMMLAYGAYVPVGVSLARSALVISGAILIVSLLATVMIFPLVYEYGLNPAQGPDLVFNVLPIAFAEMPAGRMIGTLFFLLLLLSALTPTLAGLEPLVAWLQQRHGLGRAKAAWLASLIVWMLGIGSVLSFNRWAGWHPLAAVDRLKHLTVFDTLDFISSNLMLTLGALLTCILVGWRLPLALIDSELAEDAPWARRLILLLLRYACPIGIVAVLLAAIP